MASKYIPDNLYQKKLQMRSKVGMEIKNKETPPSDKDIKKELEKIISEANKNSSFVIYNYCKGLNRIVKRDFGNEITCSLEDCGSCRVMEKAFKKAAKKYIDTSMTAPISKPIIYDGKFSISDLEEILENLKKEDTPIQNKEINAYILLSLSDEDFIRNISFLKSNNDYVVVGGKDALDKLNKRMEKLNLK